MSTFSILFGMFTHWANQNDSFAVLLRSNRVTYMPRLSGDYPSNSRTSLQIAMPSLLIHFLFESWMSANVNYQQGRLHPNLGKELQFERHKQDRANLESCLTTYGLTVEVQQEIRQEAITVMLPF